MLCNWGPFWGQVHIHLIIIIVALLYKIHFLSLNVELSKNHPRTHSNRKWHFSVDETQVSGLNKTLFAQRIPDCMYFHTPVTVLRVLKMLEKEEEKIEVSWKVSFSFKKKSVHAFMHVDNEKLISQKNWVNQSHILIVSNFFDAPYL